MGWALEIRLALGVEGGAEISGMLSWRRISLELEGMVSFSDFIVDLRVLSFRAQAVTWWCWVKRQRGFLREFG